MLNLRIKQYITWVYFLIYPLTNAFFPNLDLGVVEFNPFRIFLLIPLAYLLHVFLINHGRIRISREMIFIGAYTVFTLVNSWWTENFIPANVMNLTFPVLFMLTMENLDYEEKDLDRFFRMLTILATVVFAVSLIQQFIDPFFYAGVRGQRWLYRYMDFGQGRHSSIFRSIDFYQGGVAMGMMCLIFMFKNAGKFSLKYTTLCGMMLVCIYLTLTRSNWLIPMIGFMVFVWYKPAHKKAGILTVTLLASLVIYFVIFPIIEASEVYQRRVAATTYEGRFQSLEVYMEHFFGKNLLTGFGIDSGYAGVFRAFDRPEVHIGYLEVLFQNGLVGIFLYSGFWFYFFKRGRIVRKFTGNAVFIPVVLMFLAINTVYKFISMSHYGYHMMFFYLIMLYRLRVPGAPGAIAVTSPPPPPTILPMEKKEFKNYDDQEIEKIFEKV